MKLTKKLQAEILKIYNTYWDAYLAGDMKTFASMLDDNIKVFGTAVSEVFNNKTETVRFYKATADQMTGKAEFRNRKIKMNPVEETVLIHEQSNLFVLIENEWIFYSPVRVSAIFVNTPKGWKLTHQHGSFPDSRAEAGEQIAPEKIKRENLELREAIKRRTVELENKNRELEIEASLEKVRTIAMGMREPANMLDVCKTISLQLQSLGVKEIRNVQTAIIYASKSIYINYEYYAKHKKQFITEVDFKSHYYQKLFVNKMLKGTGEIFTKTIKGKKVKEWYEHQKTTNQFADSYLGKAKSLSYYWFSLGPLALGISTYSPLSEEQLNLFIRFRNVFELAYQRYLDIEKAEAQAREAQIEASLERVRAVAMSMNKSDDLISICEVSYKEFQKLGFNSLRNAIIHIPNDEKKYFMDYDFSDLTGGAITKIEYGSHPVVEDYLKQIKSAKNAFAQTVLKEDQLEEWKDFRRNSGQIDDPRLDKATALYYYFFSIGIGDIGISTLKSIDESQIQILKRFRNVFDLAYRRYTDITQAEAQAREAKIEAALERVRSRSMAMYNTADLGAVVFEMFTGLLKLDAQLDRCIIMIVDSQTLGINWYLSGKEGLLSNNGFLVQNNPHPSHQAYLDGWRTKSKKWQYHLAGEEKKHWDAFGFSQTGLAQLPDFIKADMSAVESIHLTISSDDFGSLIASSLSPLSEAHASIVDRFTTVFNQTYTRFLDLQKAEAQAREAEIQLALERVRARTMAMQKSDELKEVVVNMFDGLKSLGVDPTVCNISLMDTKTCDSDVWSAHQTDNGLITYRVFISHFEHPFRKKLIDSFLNKISFSVHELSGDLKKSYIQYLIDHVDYSKVPYEVTKSNEKLVNIEEGIVLSAAYMKYGLLIVSRSHAISNDESDILQRFSKIFQQTYTRFLDLQKAEAQAREAQIEAALEKVRSRTMGMQKSEELKVVIRVVYEQFVHLKINLDHAGFVVDYTPKGDWHFWIADDQDIPSKITHPYFESVWANQFNEAKEKGADFFATNLNFEEKNKFYNELLLYVPGLPEASIDFYLSCPGLAATTVLFDNVSLYIENFSGIPYTDEENNMLMRFGKVFQQTHTRFLDLQKAETQAREAKIEASLERVRSKAMAMHSPNDLSDTVNVFFKELKTLGIIPIRCGVGQIDEATRTTSLTTTTSSQQGESLQVIGKVKQTGHPVLDGIFDHWKLQKEYHPVLEGEELKAYYNVMNAQIGYPEYPEEVTQYGNSFFFKEGFVFAWTENLLSEEELIIFRRFTSALSLTYRRYMDLKEAEAQAKEAQIEAALERVRSRTMGMQKSDELAETVSVLFKQLLDLGVKSTQLRTCGIATFKENEPKGEIWITDITGEIISDSFDAPYDEAPAYKTIYSKWKSGEKFLELNLKGDAFLEHLNFVKKYSGVPNINLDEIKKLYTEIFIHIIYFSQGYLFIISYEALIEYHEIFKRFGALFHQTYTRFLDFKKVEAQNKIIQAENERKTKELEDARQLQLAMLPRELPKVSNLDIAVYMKTATEVGGDYYDFNFDINGTLTVVLGDATGHGMMSGMMVSIMKSFFISNKVNIELKQFFENANNSIKDMNLGRLMMSFMGVQITSNKVIATNAGMPSLIYFRNKSQKAGEFVSNNLPLGAMKGTKYLLKEIVYEKGDALLLMSDGFAELKNKNNEQYGYPRIIEEFRTVAHKNSDAIVEHLKNSATEWIIGVEPDDDVTFVVIKIRQ